MFENLQSVESRYAELERLMAEAAERGDYDQITDLARERSEIEPLVTAYRDFQRIQDQIAEHEALAGDADPEMAALAREELPALRAEEERLTAQIKQLLVPRDPNDEKNVIIEIRAGAGGDEAALFAAELYRMYTRYAERQRWKIETRLDQREPTRAASRKSSSRCTGRGAYSHLKYESGVHRVQRVPVTESGGRIHTSTATVAVLPEAEEVEVEINPADLRIDVYRSTGHGGQSVNTTDSAVRITHLPTGHGRHLPGREVAAQEPQQGDGRAARPALRHASCADASSESWARRAARRWAPATAARRSAPTTSRRTASPTTASS